MDNFTSQLKLYWQISRNYSKPYLICQLLVFLLVLSNALSNFLVIGGDTFSAEMQAYALRGLFEGTMFIGFSHYVIRSFLKTQFINRNLILSRVAALGLILIVLASVHMLVLLNFDTLGMFGKANPSEVSFFIGDEEHVIDVKSPFIMGIVILGQFGGYLLWSMGYIFWHSTRTKRELQKQVQEVRIQQLTNQLNPHFLFNTLNSIRALIFEDKNKAADLVTQLSELFRTHLQAHLKPASSVEEEWRLAEQYLQIEKVRFEERMQVQCNIEDTLRGQKLPTLTLLTLMENAVKHGISPNPNSGFIHISASSVNDKRWQLQVSNSYEGKTSNNGTKTGLKNTLLRLELMFAGQAQIEVKKHQNVFKLTLELPYV